MSYFDDTMPRPKVIRLHFVRDEVLLHEIAPRCEQCGPANVASPSGLRGYPARRLPRAITTRVNGEHHEVVPQHNPIRVKTLMSILKNISGTTK